MPPGTWTFTDAGRTMLLNGTFDLDTDTFRLALFLSTSNIGPGSTTYAGLTDEHANANGYLTGGYLVGSLVLSGTTVVIVDNPLDSVWAASGGSIIARYVVLYEVGGNVLCYALMDDTPADITVPAAESLIVEFASGGIFTLP